MSRGNSDQGGGGGGGVRVAGADVGGAVDDRGFFGGRDFAAGGGGRGGGMDVGAGLGFGRGGVRVAGGRLRLPDGVFRVRAVRDLEFEFAGRAEFGVLAGLASVQFGPGRGGGGVGLDFAFSGAVRGGGGGGFGGFAVWRAGLGASAQVDGGVPAGDFHGPGVFALALGDAAGGRGRGVLDFGDDEGMAKGAGAGGLRFFGGRRSAEVADIFSPRLSSRQKNSAMTIIFFQTQAIVFFQNKTPTGQGFSPKKNAPLQARGRAKFFQRNLRNMERIRGDPRSASRRNMEKTEFGIQKTWRRPTLARALPHYHRRCGVSPSCSGWGGVVPPLHDRQANLLLQKKPKGIQPQKIRAAPQEFPEFQKTNFKIQNRESAHGYGIKPLGQLVPVSLTRRRASTSGLSTSLSSRVLAGDSGPREVSSWSGLPA